VIGKLSPHNEEIFSNIQWFTKTLNAFQNMANSKWKILFALLSPRRTAAFQRSYQILHKKVC
jgi:hypothetical protein